MSVKNTWYDADRTIIFTQYVSPWSWDDYTAGLKEMYAMADSVGRAVDIIAYSVDKQMPLGNPLHVARNAYRDPQEFDAIVVYVNMPPIIHTFVKLYEAISPAFKGRSFFASSVDEAERMIRSRRMTNASNQ